MVGKSGDLSTMTWMMCARCAGKQCLFLIKIYLLMGLRDSFPLDYPIDWYKEVINGRYLSYGLFQ
jgi:hypothetical protein